MTGPVTIVYIEDHGRFVWSPVLQVLDWVPKGYQRPQRTWALTETQNTTTGVIRKVGKLLHEAADTF